MSAVAEAAGFTAALRAACRARCADLRAGPPCWQFAALGAPGAVPCATCRAEVRGQGDKGVSDGR